MVSARHSEELPFSTISSSDNLQLGIRLGLGLGSVVWLWQYQELFPATTMNDGFQNGGPFGMADPNPINLAKYEAKFTYQNSIYYSNLVKQKHR